MILRRVSFILSAGLASLALASCGDDKIYFPGFEEKPGAEENVPPPPNTLPPPPTIPADTLPPRLPVNDPLPAPETPDESPADDTINQETPAPDLPPPEQTDEIDQAEADDASDEGNDTPTGVVDDGADNTSETIDTQLPSTDEATGEASSETIGETEPPAEGTPPIESEPPAEVEPPIEAEPPVEAPLPPVAPAFRYHAPGSLTPGSGQGSPDETVYAPDMVFPIKDARAFPQSMVFYPGGFRYAGDLPGDECIPENYEYPWRDNFCERGRPASFKSASCPAGSGVHLGQDIRVGNGPTCESMRRQYRTNTQAITNYKVVAAEDGVISNISSYTVSLRAGPRTYRYLHMNMRALQVSIGDTVTAGQHIGYVSKDFGGTPTTFHLHFVLKINTDEGSVFVPPYTSLVESYARRESAPGERIERSVAIASDTLTYDPTEVFEFVE